MTRFFKILSIVIIATILILVVIGILAPKNTYFTKTEIIKSPVSVVWRKIVDVKNYPTWQSSVKKVELQSGLSPAEGKYLSSTTSVSDTDSNLLSAYNIASDENIKRIKLDAYVSPTIPTGASSNKNDDFYSYYQSIVGEPRLIVNLTVVNPKYLGLDVGDLVAYNDTFLPFNGKTGWDDYVFMITDVSRSVGSLKITLRDIENG